MFLESVEPESGMRCSFQLESQAVAEREEAESKGWGVWGSGPECHSERHTTGVRKKGGEARRGPRVGSGRVGWGRERKGPLRKWWSHTWC